MKFFSWGIVWPLIIVLFAIKITNASELSIDTIDALAIYDANLNTSDNLPENEVIYNVIEFNIINSIIEGIDPTERDCAGMQAKNTTYLYIKFKDGTREVYHLFLLDSHLAIKNQRHTCFFIEKSARSLIISNKQFS